ncbi:hypothetical protein V1478_007998 [Vespula squamosa]|uniref:Uncharacterized protein n=1 Tax=Vespula squamosa TaxID=30214 RepID=A0ABD2AXX7_VESSQ
MLRLHNTNSCPLISPSYLSLEQTNQNQVQSMPKTVANQIASCYSVVLTTSKFVLNIIVFYKSEKILPRRTKQLDLRCQKMTPPESVL